MAAISKYRVFYASGSGQSMGEYGIIIALVVVVTIVGLVAIGQAISQNMSNLISSSSQTASMSGDLSRKFQKQLQNGSSNTPALTTGGAATTAAVSAIQTASNLASSNTTALANQSVDTAGANGVSNSLANSLAAEAQKLKAEGKIDDQQLGILLQLANQGHRLAAVQKIVEDAATQAGSNRDLFLSTPVTFEGKTYANANELSQVVIGHGATYISPEIKKFESLQSQANQILNSVDPAAAQFVEQTSQQITDITANIENTTWQVSDDPNMSPSDIYGIEASKKNDKNSKDICTTGGHTDSGKSCS